MILPLRGLLTTCKLLNCAFGWLDFNFVVVAIVVDVVQCDFGI